MIGLAQPPSRGSAVGTPAYQVVIDHISKAIESGAYRPGAQLPSIAQLAALTGTNATAVKTALMLLRERGTVRGQQGKGTYVADE